MAALASDWLRHFRLLFLNSWTEFNETWQEARSQCPLPNLCVSSRSEKQYGHPGIWLAETFSTSSETAERNSTKLDRKQDLNVLYQVCVFRTDQKNKMAALVSDWLRHFRLLWNRWTEFNETWQKARFQRRLPSLCSSGRSEKTRWRPWSLIGWDIFDFSSETAERNSTKLDRKQDQNVLYKVCVFRADQLTKMSALADFSKRWHIVLRCTICGPLGLLLQLARFKDVSQTSKFKFKSCWFTTRNFIQHW